MIPCVRFPAPTTLLKGRIAIGLAALAGAGGARAQQRTVPEVPAAAPTAGFYPNSWALVIGINAYPRVPGLGYAVVGCK